MNRLSLLFVAPCEETERCEDKRRTEVGSH